MNSPSIVLGTMTFGYPYVSTQCTPQDEEDLIRIYCEAQDAHRGSIILDTARYYRNERRLSDIVFRHPHLESLRPNIQWSSKANPWFNNDFSSHRFGGYQYLVDQLNESLENCRLPYLDTFFLHAPDPDTSIEMTLKTIDDLYRQDKFKQWGLSNFSLEQCEMIYKVCQEKEYPCPRVYQGMYNLFCRKVEEVFPWVRRHNLSFWAYNPLLGGLVCHKKVLRSDVSGKTNQGRFQNPIYQQLFYHPTLIASCHRIPDGQGLRFALTWLRDHSLLSYDDKVILGASSPQQLQQNLHVWNTSPSLTLSELDLVQHLYSSIHTTDIPNYFY